MQRWCVFVLSSLVCAMLAAAPSDAQTLTMPTISWQSPIPTVTEGMALGGAQLNATANVPGTFEYMVDGVPAAGYAPWAGWHVVFATFTPADPLSYTTASAWNLVLVMPPLPREAPTFISDVSELSGGEWGYVTDERTDTVYSVNGVTGEIGTMDGQRVIRLQYGQLSGRANGLAIDISRNRLYASDYTNQNLLWSVDLASGNVLAPVDVGEPIGQIIADDFQNTLYFLTNTDVGGYPFALNLQTMNVTPIPLEGGALRLALDGTRRRLYEHTVNSIHMIDVDQTHASFHQVLSHVVLPEGYGGAVGAAQVDLKVDRISGRVYFSAFYLPNHATIGMWAPDANPAIWLTTLQVTDLPGGGSEGAINYVPQCMEYDAIAKVLYVKFSDTYGTGGWLGAGITWPLTSLAAFDGSTLELSSMTPLGSEQQNTKGNLHLDVPQRRLFVGYSVGNSGFALPPKWGTSVYEVDWASASSASLAAGAGSANLAGATIVFQQVTAPGTVEMNPRDPASISLPPPGGFTLSNALAFELTTTAQFAGTARICVDASFINDPDLFAALRLLHGENGAWVDRTVSTDYETGQICADVTSFSPLVVARRTTPPYSVVPLYDQSKAFKRGSTAPIKLQITRGGTNQSSAQIPLKLVSIVRTSDASTAPIVDAGNANPDDNFRFDQQLGGSGGYIFNLSTRGLDAGVYQVRFRIGSDPSLYSISLQVR